MASPASRPAPAQAASTRHVGCRSLTTSAAASSVIPADSQSIDPHWGHSICSGSSVTVRVRSNTTVSRTHPEVGDHTDDGGTHRGQRVVQGPVAQESLDVAGARDDEHEALRERHPDCDGTAEHAREQWRQAARGVEGRQEPDDWTTRMSGPGVVSASPSPATMSSASIQP